MDRFITREPRNEREYMQQGNRIMTFPSNASFTQDNVTYLNKIHTVSPASETYHGGYGAEFPGSAPMQHGSGRFGNMSMGSIMVGAGDAPQMAMPLYASTSLHAEQTRLVSGIDQQYLASYADSSAAIIPGQQKMQYEQSKYNPNQNQMSSGNFYRSFSGPESGKTFVPQMVVNHPQPQPNQFRREENNQHNAPLADMQKFVARDSQNNYKFNVTPNQQDAKLKAPQPQPNQLRREENNQHNASLAGVQKFVARDSQNNFNFNVTPKQQDASLKAPVKSSTEISCNKNENENTAKTRFDKLKELHRSGPRVFSGPVENVLKWHKSLQDLGLLIIFEVVAKCVSVRQGEWCSKHLVIRDEQGPAMQVVYYEIDFLLPELKPPCTIRAVGRIVAGTSRLHAFCVRAAAGDDVATLPRRAAVAAQHVAILCSQYPSNPV